jgi:hypothetical protein
LDFNTESLNDRDVDMTIAGWEAMKPKEPRQPEPLFVWPQFFGPLYFIRVWRWKRKMKATSWDFFHQRYQQWMFMITDHYNVLAGDRDRYQVPQLMRLWKYQIDAQDRLHENSMSQAEWNRQKSNHP